MAVLRGGGARGGGILALAAVAFSAEYGPAIESDLIDCGLRLRWISDGTDRLTWRDLQVRLQTAGRDTRLFAAVNPELAEWTADTDLLTLILHTLQGANWQRSGGKGPKPELLGRPSSARDAGETTQENPPEDASGVYKGDPLPPGEMLAWLGWDSADDTTTPAEGENG